METHRRKLSSRGAHGDSSVSRAKIFPYRSHARHCAVDRRVRTRGGGDKRSGCRGFAYDACRVPALREVAIHQENVGRTGRHLLAGIEVFKVRLRAYSQAG